MKRLIWIITFVVILAASASAFADTVTPLQVWKADADGKFTITWPAVQNSEGNSGHELAEAKATKSGDKRGYCNLPKWGPYKFTNTVDLAQWIDWYITGTSWDWQVRKPGKFATDCIEAKLQSNAAVTLTFAGFGDLTWDAAANEGRESITPTITTWYAFSNMNTPPDVGVTSQVPAIDKWFRATALQPVPGDEAVVFTIDDSQELHNGYVYKMYNRIDIIECNSAGTYSSSGWITIAKTVNDVWIDTTTGVFFK